MNKYNIIMKKKLIQVRTLVVYVLPLILLLGSCSVKKIVYFNDLPIDSARVVKEAARFNEPIIQPDDILSIMIQTIDPVSSAVANQAMATQAVGASSATNTGTQVISGFFG